MAVIRFFATNGHRQTKSSAPIDYLLGIYSALTPQQKNERSTIADAIRVARDKNDAPLVHRLNQQLRLIHGVQRTPPPELLAGNPRDITYAIEISPHKYKYTSGVIAHAIEDNQTLSSNPDIAQEFRALMEELVFAGLPIEDRMILWVQHTHEQNLENHFLIPRINLRTGKYFNPHPPGAEGDFNAIRDYLNLKHNLARPDDPQRQRLTGTIPRYSKNADLIAALSDAVQLRVTQGQLCNRQAVIDWLEQPQTRQMYGISEVEAKKDYIRIVPEGKIKAFRLKGPLFSRAFTSIDVVRPTLTITTPPQPSLDALWQQIEERIAKRRAFNQSRYNVTETLHPMPSPRPVRRPTGMAAVITQRHRKQPTNALFWQQQMQLYAGYTLTPINPEGTLTVDTEKALIQLLMKILSAILALLGVNHEFRETIIRVAQFYQHRADELDSNTQGAGSIAACHTAADNERPSGLADHGAAFEHAYQRQQRLCRELHSSDERFARTVAGAGSDLERLRREYAEVGEIATRGLRIIMDNPILAAKRIARFRMRPGAYALKSQHEHSGQRTARHEMDSDLSL